MFSINSSCPTRAVPLFQHLHSDPDPAPKDATHDYTMTTAVAMLAALCMVASLLSADATALGASFLPASGGMSLQRAKLRMPACLRNRCVKSLRLHYTAQR
ncbi:hypothetical protein WJX73_001086 [Symbiochloris irregularis]|uniref:Uncharacterized protein n=1 Tax=Symbiochloris irregularis TaxID=706552 RepID=A0AAW1NY04_9CHLO